MRETHRVGAFDHSEMVRKFLGLRMIVLALVVGAGIMIMQLSQDHVSVGPMYVLLGLCYIAGACCYLGLRTGLRPTLVVWAIMVADIIFETIMLHYSGGVTSQFSLVFCLTIIAAAILLQVSGGLVIAFLASLGYVAYGALEAGGLVVPPNATVTGENAGALGFLESYMHVSLFFLVGAVGGYLAERVTLRGHQLTSAKTELKQLKIDTDNILRNMSSGVLVVDYEGNIVTINPSAEAILGVDKADIMNMSVENALEPLLPAFSNELMRVLDNEENIKRHEITVTRSNSSEMPLGLSISILRDDEGQKRGAIAVFQDLTGAREMEERVRKADRLAAIGELSAGIAHEIRNPLASISGSIEMLYNDVELEDENKRLMELIMKESDRLDRIISDFLEYARLRPPSLNRVSVATCVDEVVALLGNNPTVKNEIETLVGHASDDLTVRFDEEQMKQVLLNLAINACEAMRGTGVLSITTERVDSRWVKISFADEGDGVAEQTRDRLFEPFFTTKEGGTGLGLAIANKIVEAHGGRIEVRNREVRGAEFAIILPIDRSRELEANHEKVEALV